MHDRVEQLREQLVGIEEELRDLAYERLGDLVRDPDSDGAGDAAATEKRFSQARRAIARAIGALEAI